MAIIAGAIILFLVAILALNLISPEKRIERRVMHRYGIGDPQFRRELGVMLGPPIVDGNRVENLENGSEIFPAMLTAIRGAHTSINFETYIYWSGEIGKEFATALAERARAGVKVNVILDWLGSQKIEAALLQEMTSAGVRVERFHPLHWYSLGRINNRTHRKLLIVDGRLGFTGGVGIADPWNGKADPPDHWRDSHYRLEGPAVAQMQAAFSDIWIKMTGEVLQGPEYFPELTASGEVLGQVFTSSPSGGADSMELMYLLTIAAAEQTLDLSAAYFLPDELTRHALIDALKRGVRVRVLTPGDHVDTQLVKRASRATWGELIEAGAEIYTFSPTLFHCKLMIVDGQLVSVGSTNFDNRSFRLNEEANLNVYDAEFAKRVTGVFEADLTQAHRVTDAEWRNRPLKERVLEKIAAMFSKLL